VSAGPARPPTSAPKAAGQSKGKTSPPKHTKPAKGAGGKKLSALDAAAKVLAASSEPLSCAELAEKIIARKLWKTSGKTPAATLNAAIIREIRDKKGASRFKKTGRGRFAATKR
jgi:hypothetical protein